MLIYKILKLAGTICLLGVALSAVGQIPTGLQLQRCGDVRQIYANTSLAAKRVKAFFEANCNEPEETGEVTVYDGTGGVSLSLVIRKGHPQTLTFDVPGNGHLNYICRPPHDTPNDLCGSKILSVSDVPAEDSKP